ncbi:MAG: hypothetical protein ACYC7J_20415 [Syntrophales bacterium]
MYISAQQILNWNNQYADDRTANRGALTHISADDPRGWVQGPDYVAPVHTLTGEGYASAGDATFGLTDPMTLWAQQQSDGNAVYARASAPSLSASLAAVPPVDSEPVLNAVPPTGTGNSIPDPKVNTMPSSAPTGTEPGGKGSAGKGNSTPDPKVNIMPSSVPTGTEPGGKGSAGAASGSLYAQTATPKNPTADPVAARTAQPTSRQNPAADLIAAHTTQPADSVSDRTITTQNTRDRYVKLFGALAARGIRYNLPWDEA